MQAGGLACLKTSGEQPVRDVSRVKPRAGSGSEPGVGCRGEPAQEGSLSQTQSGLQSRSRGRDWRVSGKAVTAAVLPFPAYKGISTTSHWIFATTQ